MIKRILVPLDGSEFARTATARACDLAKRTDAEVIGLAVLDLLGATGQIAPFHAVALKAYHEHLREAKFNAAQQMEESLGQFREICTGAKVRHVEHELQGIPANCIVDAAAYCDLAIMGLRTFYHYPSTAAGDSLARVLDRSCTPILAVPKYLPELPQSILIAYDGSHQATRALHAAANLNLVLPFKKGYLVCSDPDGTRRSFLLKQAAAYLRSHELECLTLIDTSVKIAQIIHDEYLEKVDLIALGVHATKPMKDFFVGSLTKGLIKYGHMPLLLAQ